MQRTGGRAKCGERQRETREGLRGSWAGGGRGGRALGCATWAALPGPRSPGPASQDCAVAAVRAAPGCRAPSLSRGGARSCGPGAPPVALGGSHGRALSLARGRPASAPRVHSALQEKLRPRDGTAGPVQRQDRGRAPGWLCGRGCLPGAGRRPEGAEREPLPGRRPAPPAPRTASGQDSRGHAEGEQRRREVSRPGRKDQRLAARSPSRGSPCPALPSFQIFLKKPENSDFYGNAPQFNSSSKQRRRGPMGLGHQPLAGAVPGVT